MNTKKFAACTAKDFAGCTALVVDDSEVHRQIMAAMLSKLDFGEVHVAGDGEEGLQKTERLRPDVVVCDLRMEPANGFEYLRQLRNSEDETLKDTPVIIVTGLTSPGTAMKSIALEGNAFIAKPFRRQSLEDALQRIFQ